jgi:oligopeptide/dipeptide ABC transporter ATP-binding protein
MYAGRLMELGRVKDMFTDPLNPYTQLLIKSIPGLSNRGDFTGIPGITPPLAALPPGCVFNDRCPYAMPVCTTEMPPLLEHKPLHWASCYLYENGVEERVENHGEVIRT